MGMLNRIARLISRRSLDAAAGGRRWDGARQVPSANAAVTAGAGTVSQRAVHAYLNNPVIRNAVNTYAANAVGTGIWPKSRHPSEPERRRLDDAFTDAAADIDVAGRHDLAGVQRLATVGVIVHGEAFIRLRMSGTGDLRVQMIAADQVDRTLHRDLAEGGNIRSGIEFDADGRPVAYHVLPAAPGDMLAPLSWNHVRVPASEILHVFEAMEPGQVRGLSWLASVLLKAKEVDEYEDAQLVRQKVAALLAGFLVDATGAAEAFEGTRSGSILETGLEPGTLKVLPPGFDIKFSEPAEIGETTEFLRTQLRAIAAGLGITYEQLTGDLSGVNYSSIRAGLVEFRRKVDVFRWTVLVPQLCRPLWDRFITLRVLRGEIPAGAFERDRRAWLACDWNPPAWEWVDPLKDIQAETAAVEAGFKSRSQVVAALGEDAERVDALRAEDEARAKRLGVPSPRAAAPRSGVGVVQHPDPVEPEQEEGKDA
ncbi:phage portal protein [Caenispirillum bisanense]